jgi:hypothetical protein
MKTSIASSPQCRADDQSGQELAAFLRATFAERYQVCFGKGSCGCSALFAALRGRIHLGSDVRCSHLHWQHPNTHLAAMPFDLRAC